MEHVFLDEKGVDFREASGAARTMPWESLVEVVVVTTASGPLADDVFFVLSGADGRKLSVPSSAEGFDALLERLQELPGFDNGKFIEAMSCAADATFPCWKKP